MRLFIGIEVPAEVKNNIATYLAPLKNSEKGWEKPHDYHLTLLFIGDVPNDVAPLIRAQMQAIAFTPFEVKLGGLAFFNRRVAYIAIESSDELLALREKVHEVFPEWSKVEEKPFVPHITVKRWQRYEFDELQQGLEGRSFAASIQVSSISLFHSEKDADGFKYHVI
jgi:RNA 2',3'-cyclic 3'-phosphodiesterase